jgi:hypothetical protein
MYLWKITCYISYRDGNKNLPFLFLSFKKNPVFNRVFLFINAKINKMEVALKKEYLEKFILGGRALFTIKNEQTGNRFTYSVVKPNDETPYFVKVLRGANNETDYSFIGSVFRNSTSAKYVHSKKSKVSEDAQSVKVIKYLLGNLSTLPSQIKIYHSGNCGKCGRTLTDPISIETGLGPHCRKG